MLIRKDRLGMFGRKFGTQIVGAHSGHFRAAFDSWNKDYKMELRNELFMGNIYVPSFLWETFMCLITKSLR